MLRFLYLNIYSFLLAFIGILALVLPFYLLSPWTLAIQGIVAIAFFVYSARLFSTWDHKRREIDLLIKRNQDGFRPETFDVFMQVPCGRLIVKCVLKELKIQNQYQSLLKLQKAMWQRIHNYFQTTKTVIFINDKKV